MFSIIPKIRPKSVLTLKKIIFMSGFKDLVQQRRSHRKFTQEPVSEADLKTILRAGLMAPTGKGLRKWHFAVTQDRAKIQALSEIRPGGSQFVETAAAVIVVMGGEEHELWVEDCSIAATVMQLQIEDLGLGSCWCHVRGRASREEGLSAQDKVRQILGLDPAFDILCLIALGHPCDERKPQDEDKLLWDSVNWLE